jgi:hypothetical protein
MPVAVIRHMRTANPSGTLAIVAVADNRVAECRQSVCFLRPLAHDHRTTLAHSAEETARGLYGISQAVWDDRRNINCGEQHNCATSISLPIPNHATHW